MTESVQVEPANVTLRCVSTKYTGLVTNPEYLRLWDFEKETDQDAWAAWHEKNWDLAIAASLVYLITIFGIRRKMERKDPFQLRKALVLWNISLAAFSVIGFFRSFPELEFHLKSGQIHQTICSRDQRNAATAFWGILFGLSKIVELGDTLFIVLRKQPLIFLHYYHHVSVLCYTWFTAHAINSTCVWFGVMNYGVHSFMYSYYALKALQIKIPKGVAMAITLLQLLQMVAGVGINFYVLYAKSIGIPCDTQKNHVYFALGMYGSYLFLFAKFFRRAYLLRKEESQRKFK